MLLPIIIATTIVGLVSLIGVIIIFSYSKTKPPMLKSMISLAAGTLLAVSLLDLLPEAIEESNLSPKIILGVTLISILFFFLFERVLHWHHCRCDEDGHDHKHVKPANKKNLIYSNLFGDALHNIIDGFLIAAAFLLNFETGVLVTLAVIIHEIPQEISDFSILLYAGLDKSKAILANFLIALTAIMGGVLFFYFGNNFDNLIPIMAAFAAGNFIYLSTTDLIPELHHEKDPKKIIVHSAWLILGVAIIFLAQIALPHLG